MTTSCAVVDLSARRRAGEQAVLRRASAPVLHITPEFLAALNCRDERPSGLRTRRLHAV